MPAAHAGLASFTTSVCREFTFDAAHQLEWHAGECRRLHGHTYRLQVWVAGPVDDRGVVIDFADLDKVVKEHVLLALDHHFLNEMVDNPTAERIACWTWERLTSAGLTLAEVVLWETPRSAVRLRAQP